MGIWRALFDPAFMPHGHCYFWTPSMVWVQAGANSLIGLAYLAISLTLVHLVRRIRDIPFQWVYIAFGVFIITCGFTHFLDTVTIWRPIYWIDAAVRVVTAAASIGTAVLLFPLFPKAVALGEAARLAHERGIQLERLNGELRTLYARTREGLADAIPQLVWTSEPDGSVEAVNARWTGYTGREAPGPDAGPDGWLAAVVPEDRPAALERWRRSLATGEPFEQEVRLRRQDGEALWHLVRALPLREEGRALRWFGTCTDIDERRRSQATQERLLREVEAGERRFRATFAQAAVGIAHVGLDGGWLRLNRRYCEILGYTQEELLGKSFQDVTHPDDLAADMELSRRLLADEMQTYVMEKRYLRKDGSDVWVNLTASLVRLPNGAPEYFIAVAEDIGGRKQIEAQREELLARLHEAVRVREVFLAVAAHEMRTPVTPLRTQIEGILRKLRAGRLADLAPERLEQKLALALRQTERLERLIDRLLDVSRLASGKVDLHPETLDLALLVRETADRHRPTAEEVGIPFTAETPTSLIGRFDRDRVEQVVDNLVSNAIKFSAHRPVTLALHQEDERAVIVVRDQGPGIPPEEQTRIFGQFERVASARHFPGLGLGLWVVRELVDAMGGEVRVDSEPGQGATFTVRLPLQLKEGADA